MAPKRRRVMSEQESEDIPPFLWLDDSSLLAIFTLLDPLPDLFYVARVCKVAPVVGVQSDHRCQFSTLAAAVANSRPGDTILMLPSPTPYDASGVIVPHPLHIMGGGSAPEETVLRCSSDALPALFFGATARLANVTIEGGVGGCVTHLAGRLLVDTCVLRCHPRGLLHLSSPVETVAASPLPNPVPPEARRVPPLAPPIPVIVKMEDTSAVMVKDEERAESSGNAAECHSIAYGVEGLIGPGVLLVAESAMEGGSSAVRCRGTGGLSAVRVIYEARKTLFWFQVDSTEPPLAPHGEPSTTLLKQEDGSVEEIEGAAEARMPEVPGPAWVALAPPSFDPAALQAQVTAVLAAHHQQAVAVDVGP